MHYTNLILFKVLIVLSILFINQVGAYVHPITIHGHFFVDSVTKEPFYIKGIDYQPGGSSAVSNHKDPLSDPEICARDIILFQELGINTIRIYSVNADLDHNVCMTMLATAGIYLVLDVNSPLPNHHLNRYEPWTTYNLFYLENVFKIVEQFSYYNNTLGFIAGNEVVSDPTSASVAPPYIKGMIRDIKTYIEYNSPRTIPVGYSAADDLNYRMSLASYLECADENPAESVDFYGVNSYQWCGEQTFYSSGYNILVNDYHGFTRPVFFSEYGCNEVLPRNFDEVQVLYTNDMIGVFSGGLVYEFTQEPNNYGLVEVQPDGDIKLLRDFMQLKKQFDSIPELDYAFVANSMRTNAREIHSKLKQYKSAIPKCGESYPNIGISIGIPVSIAENLIETGVKVKPGHYVHLEPHQLTTKYNIFQANGEKYPTYLSIEILVNVTQDEPESSVTPPSIVPHVKNPHSPPPETTEIEEEFPNEEEDVAGSDPDNSTTNSFRGMFQRVATSFKKLYSSLFN